MFIDSIFEINYSDKNKKKFKLPEILDKVIGVCVNTEFITSEDIECKSKKYEWICSFVDIHLTAMAITDYLDGNDIPKSNEDYDIDNELKAKVILEQIASKILLSSPNLTSVSNSVGFSIKRSKE
ncbi:TPA: hypothetical protein ACF33V_003499 [Vibrio parahaemolyticus]|nr:hypothetical protein [Vibrio fluvialis]